MTKKPAESQSVQWRDVLPTVLVNFFKAAFSSKTLVPIAACWFLYNWGITALLPPAERLGFATESSDDAARLAGDLVDSPWYCYGGWVVAAILLFFGVPYVVFQNRRIKRQGTTISELRFQLDPGRHSSLNPVGLADYAARDEDKRDEDKEPSE